MTYRGGWNRAKEVCTTARKCDQVRFEHEVFKQRERNVICFRKVITENKSEMEGTSYNHITMCATDQGRDQGHM